MSLPIPPTNPNLTIPSRVVDNSRRLKRKEGAVLPTPRTYRYQRTGTIGTTSGTGNLAISDASMPQMWIQPGEVFQVFMRIELQASAASTNGRLRFNDDHLALGHSWYDGIVSAAPSWDKIYTEPLVVGAKESPTNFFPGGPITMPAIDLLTGPAIVVPYLTLNRSSGAGNITAKNFYMNVIIF